MLTRIKQMIHRLRVKGKCIFEKNVIIDSRCTFEGANRITNDCTVLNTQMGYASYIGERSFIKNTQLGRYTCIATDVMTIPGNHPTESFVSMHPAFYSTRKQCGFTYVTSDKFSDFNFIDSEKQISVSIGSDVWIGQGVRILEGVHIGNGAVVATGAVVTKDVEPYSIVGGVPAKHIKYRFDGKTREELLELKWWDKDQKWIREHAEQFESVELLLKNI